MINLWLKVLLNSLGLGAIAYFVLCLALYWGQNRLIFLPSRHVKATPRDLDLAYEDVWLSVTTPDGKSERLHGWWIPAKSERVLLYLHGNGGNISYNLAPAERFHRLLGFSVFIIDYRGYGRSEGEFPSEAEVYRDAQVAWQYLVHERGIEPGNLFLYGHSLGGAIAIDLAVRKPQSAGVIVENTFTSMQDMVDYLGGIYRLFPTVFILHQRFDSVSKLRLLQVPLLLIHGSQDITVPALMSQRLYEAAQVPKKLLLIPDATHNNVGVVGEAQYLLAVEEFTRSVRINQRQLAQWR